MDDVINNKYSVVMTVYWRENPDFLRVSMESILCQTVPTDDFIIVCDGPLPKELDEVILSYAQNRPEITVIRRKVNGGAGAAAQTGLNACRHNLVMRLDSDDYSYPHRAERQLLEFSKEPDLAICGSFMAEFKESCDNVVQVREVPCDMQSILNFGRRRNPFNNITVMYRLDAVMAVGGYSDLRRCEDYELFAKMLQQGFRAKNIPEILSCARIDDGTLGRRASLDTTKGFIQLHWNLYKSGFASLVDFLVPSLLQIGYLLVPGPIRDSIYTKTMRKSGDQ